MEIFSSFNVGVALIHLWVVCYMWDLPKKQTNLESLSVLWAGSWTGSDIIMNKSILKSVLMLSNVD